MTIINTRDYLAELKATAARSKEIARQASHDAFRAEDAYKAAKRSTIRDISKMLDTTDEELTAKQISQISGLSTQEVAQNLCGLTQFNGWSKAADHRTRKVKTTFVEVDEKGAVVEGGRKIVLSRKQNVYFSANRR